MIKNFIFMMILTISLSLLSISVNAATLYVDVHGADTNTGSSNDPFRTIQKGVDTAVPGDTVYVRAGTYYERVKFSTDGSSGNPITIEGELSGDDRVAIVDGSDAVTAGSWVAAPEIGNGVYKQTSYAYEPGSMYVIDGGVPKDIPRTRHSSWATFIAKASDYTESHTVGSTVNYWDGIGAIFAYNSSTLYVHFGDDSNPASKTIRTSPDDDYAFDLSGDSYITLKNFVIRGAWVGIYMSTSNSNNIIIDNCEIYATGKSKILATSGAHTIEIKNSTMYMSPLSSYQPGGWTGGSTYDHAVKEHMYLTYKYNLAPNRTSSNEDENIRLDSVGSNITVHDNTIRYSSIGINVSGTSNEVSIYNNVIHGHWSECIGNVRASSTKIYNNLIYDANALFRAQYCEYTNNNRHAYIYNNKFWLEDGVGKHTYFHFGTKSSSPSEFADFWIYHNTFIGGVYVFGGHTYADENDGMQDTRWINNIFDSNAIFGDSKGMYQGSSDMVEVFDYNWLGGTYPYGGGLPAWSGSKNTHAEGQTVWSHSSMPDFELPAGHAARNAGIDVSTNFNINGQTYQPLPGMKPGYYANNKPDMGIFHADQTPPNPPNPPQNLRIVLN